MSSDEVWLETMWPFVRSELGEPGGRVVEIGCGPLGGFVPMLSGLGYSAVGIDPEAPDGASYRQVTFEEYEPTGPVDAVVASTSLHHVADVGEVLDKVAAVLVPGARLVILEWASERFDEATARWCFERLGVPVSDDHPGWLHHHRADWEKSGDSWDRYFGAWVDERGLHRSDEILRALEARFDRLRLEYGPYCFADLPETTYAEEQAAIDLRLIQATGVRYVATRV